MSRVRLGMIGCGGMARAHLRQLAEIEECEIAALCDPSPEQIEKCVAQYPQLANTPTFSDHREMLASAELDAVQVDTPHALHARQVLDAIEAGLHVLCEKPLATSSREARALVEAADASGLVCLLSYQRHLSSVYRRIRETVQSGELGRPTFVCALLCQDWKRLTKGTWRQDPALSGGGQLNDSGSHIVDFLLWGTGLVPESVAARCENRGAPVDIDSAVTVRFQGGALASISILGDCPIWHEELTVCFESGALLLREGQLWKASPDGSKARIEGLPADSDPDRNFVDAILGRGEVQAPFSWGLKTALVTEAAWESSARGGHAVPVSGWPG